MKMNYSFTRAEATTDRSNLVTGDEYKLLVPKKFGGGYIKDVYCNCGKVFENEGGVYVDSEGKEHKDLPHNDLYGIVAYWNNCEGLAYTGDKKPVTMLEILKNGDTTKQETRVKGIDIGSRDNDVDRLAFPLKLVSSSYNQTYENCKGRSYDDPTKGEIAYDWNDVGLKFDFLDYQKKVM